MFSQLFFELSLLACVVGLDVREDNTNEKMPGFLKRNCVVIASLKGLIHTSQKTSILEVKRLSELLLRLFLWMLLLRHISDILILRIFLKSGSRTEGSKLSPF